MRNLLIIYPHWPPSNLAGVHRARLISNFLEESGWHPVVLTAQNTAAFEYSIQYIQKNIENIRKNKHARYRKAKKIAFENEQTKFKPLFSSL